MTWRTSRKFGVVLGVLAAAAVAAVGTATVGAKSAGRPDSGTVYFAPTHQVGSLLFYAGDTTDRVMGSGAVVYQLKVLTTTKPGTLAVNIKKVTTFSATGSLVGTATAKLTILDTKGNATVTDGILSLTHGTGAQAGHSVKAKFSGKGNINTGQYKVTYTGTYT